MFTKDDILQATMLYLAHNMNVLYESVCLFIPFEKQIIAYSSNEFEDITYLFYIVKVMHYLYLTQFIAAWEPQYEVVLVHYRDANSKVYKHSTMSSILDNTNHAAINQQYVQKPCIGITLHTANNSVQLPSNLFRNHVIDDHIMDVVAFYIKKYTNEWTKLDIKYIGKKITIEQEDLNSTTIQDISA